MGRDSDEQHLAGVVGQALRRWLAKAKDAVMAPWRQYRTQPDPSRVYRVQSDWVTEMDSILTVIGRITMNAWSQASDVAPVSRHAFVMAQLAQTENFLVRIPDEVANLIFAEITDAVNGGADTDEVAQRVERVLSYTASERWPARARTIAQTETTRAYGAGTLAAGVEQSRLSGRVLQKRWDTRDDSRVRGSHREVDGRVIDVMYPFYVDGWPLMFPGDPSGPPESVINCRCSLTILNERGR
jgi:hypothetical protein